MGNNGFFENKPYKSRIQFIVNLVKTNHMKFFIDTANLEQIKEAQDLGILDGVTTNPSLMAKEGITGKKNILNHL